ncbi:hypothetical protein Poly30_16680 [Planctomycetes bacterium Poly30]|uniref:DNA methylase n=1 Tax=Saltatorellus ferox TaxID=2528018 RepID=A0A518EPZ4_9BACT|nr:hypothetical protein Poly30_16680 [Planctomycetes bacterium Poly30]
MAHAAPGDRPAREVHCADALEWLPTNPLSDDCALLTSLPDLSEFRRTTIDEWVAWFDAAAEAVLRATPDGSVAMFYQSDVRLDGRWIDKGYLVQRAAERTGDSLQWHRIVCRAPAGTPTGRRPGYAHLLCFSRGFRAPEADGAPDVVPEMGSMIWSRATGTAACEFALEWLRQHTKARVVVDPFCGHGTVLAIANRLGLGAIGVERSPGRAKKARQLQL